MERTRREAVGAIAAGAGLLAGCLSGSDAPERPCPATVDAAGGGDGRGTADARIGLVGDVMLGRNVDDRRADDPPAAVWGGMTDRLRALDGLLLNLECVLSARGEPRPGRVYHFRADPDWALPALAAGNVAWAGLANNHVLDFGPGALRDTLSGLPAAGIDRAGAGPDLEAAVAPSVVEVGGLAVAVVAFTDQSPSYAAGGDDPGTAFLRADPADPRTRTLVGAALEAARAADPDLVVASLHWGPNWETRPSALQRRFARWLVDRGVDVVHGHSAHVIQGVEVYEGRPIVYDAGDFVDDYAVKPELHNDRSFLFEAVIADGRLDALRLVPVEIRDLAVEPARPAAAAWLRDRMRRLSEPFGTTVRRANDGPGLRIPLAADCG